MWRAFMKAALGRGWTWLVEVNNHLGLAVTIIAVLGFGYVSIRVSNLWVIAFVAVAIFVLLFSRGAFLVWKDAVDASATPTQPVSIIVGFDYADPDLTVTVRNDGSQLTDTILNLVVPRDLPELALVDSGSIAPDSSGIDEWHEELDGRPTNYWWASGCRLYGHGTIAGLRFRVGHLVSPTPVIFRVGGEEVGQWRERRETVGPVRAELTRHEDYVALLEDALSQADQLQKRLSESGHQPDSLRVLLREMAEWNRTTTEGLNAYNVRLGTKFNGHELSFVDIVPTDPRAAEDLLERKIELLDAYRAGWPNHQ